MSKYGLLSPDFPPDSSMLLLDHPLLLTLQAQIYFFFTQSRELCQDRQSSFSLFS